MSTVADAPAFPAHTVQTAPERSRPALDGVRRALGFLPNLFATMAGSPETLAGYLALDGVLARGTFDAAERQLVLTAVSAANGCAYCTAPHSTFATGLRAAPDALAQFLTAAFTPAQTMEVAANVGLETISNYIDGFADITLDDALAPQRWEPTAITAR